MTWDDPDFNLGTLLRNTRKAIRDGSVSLAEYLGSLALEGNGRPTTYDVTHQFLSLAQGLESSHTARVGDYPPGTTEATIRSRHEALLDRLKSKGVNSNDRKKVQRALQMTDQRISLADRLTEIAVGLGLSYPEEPPPWDPGAGSPATTEIWAKNIARARNDLAHGNEHHNAVWLRKQSRYLGALAEFELLKTLGLSRSAARRVAQSVKRS